MAAIKTAKTYVQIGLGLEVFRRPFDKDDVPFLLMEAIGASPAILARYREGRGTVASFKGLLIKGILAYRRVSTRDLAVALEAMKRDALVVRNRPAILAVSDGDVIRAYDPAVEESYENHLSNLYTDYEFFSPLWGVRKIRNIEENDADVKAAYKMGQIHDEIRRYNGIGITANTADLNVFMSRLLFCYFAEDTGIFEKDVFTRTIEETTQQDGSDLQEFFSEAFRVMDLPTRIGVNSRYAQFPYVNGGLFSRCIEIPRMNTRIRRLIIDCGHLNWAKINPDIFGSMIQAVVSPELRSGLGIHYTSVSNIKKVINPLFLDELTDACRTLERRQQEQDSLFDQSVTGRQRYFDSCRPLLQSANRLLLRMSRMKFFDPACGSGNFLIITYKELRLLEMRLLRLIQKMTADRTLQFIDGSVIRIDQFYGIEINSFAAETAVLSLWLAEHQMNSRFTAEFQVNIRALPLKSNTNIQHANACRVRWEKVCPHTKDEEVYLMGNPPYLGSRRQDKEQKQDMEIIFEHDFGNLDYIACWFMKAAQYITNSVSKCAFVSTNSICQGEQVALLWKRVFYNKVEISFAYTSFKWSNNAKYNAGVTVIIVGLASQPTGRMIYDNGKGIPVKNISPMLRDEPTVFVESTNVPPVGYPPMNFGNMPADGGCLLFDDYEKSEFLEQEPKATPFIKPFIGADDFINGNHRWCLWLNNINEKEYAHLPLVQERINKLRIIRKNSSRPQLAAIPHLFAQITQPEGTPFILIPCHSSENRDYIPIGFFDEGNVAANSCMVVGTNDISLFGLLTSRMHMAWVRAIGGKLETRYRYSAGLCYNPFPFPTLTAAQKAEIEDAAWEVLGAREAHYGKTLAELYDPDTMPADLRAAHAALDTLVDRCYRDRPFRDDNERLELLLTLYEQMTKK